MTVILGLALIGSATTTAVAAWRGYQAISAALAVSLAALLIPPVYFHSPFLLWRDMLVIVLLGGVLGWALYQQPGSPVLRRRSPAGLRLSFPRGWQIADGLFAAVVVTPAIAVWSNGQSIEAGFLEIAEQAALWGVPYLAGRLLLRTAAGLRNAAAVIALATAAYAPLCLIESLVRPALAEQVFGVAGPNVTPMRMLLNFWGPSGYRPYVFTDSFFHLVLLQATGLVLGVGLWWSAPAWDRPRVWRVIGLIAAGVNGLALLLLSRSWAGILLPLGSLGLLGLLMSSRLRLWLVMGCLVVPVYVGLRATEVIPTAPLPLRHEDGSAFLAGRGRSINARMQDEQQVFHAVADRPLLGTGLTYRSESGIVKVAGKYPIDGAVFTRLLRSGALGLGCLLLATAWPAWMSVYRLPPRLWADRTGAVVLMLAGATVLIAHLINMLPNHGATAVQPLLAGGLVTLSRPGAAQATLWPTALRRLSRPGEPASGSTANEEWRRWAQITSAELDPPGSRSELARVKGARRRRG